MMSRLADLVEHKVASGDTLESIATSNGLSWQQLARFNWGTDQPREINRYMREIVGCTRRTPDGKNYRFDSSDEPGIVYIPKPLQLPPMALNKRHVIRVRKPKLYSRVVIQTVDYFGHRVPNVKLSLKPAAENPGMAEAIDLATDADGQVISRSVVSGRYDIFQEDGTPALYFEEVNFRDGATLADSFGKLHPASVTTQTMAQTIISLVVGPLPGEEERKQLRKKASVYNRGAKRPESEGRGEEGRGLNRRSYQTCVDNLLLAAGWTPDFKSINWPRLMNDILPGWLQTYYPSVKAQGYYVAAICEAEGKVRFINSGGGTDLTLPFDHTRDLEAFFGMYAILQNSTGPYFVDMASRSYIIGVVDQQDLGIENIVVDPAPYVDYYNRNAAKVELVCFAPTVQLLAAVALQGGTGRLEDYGRDPALNALVHSRNLSVCQNMRTVYEHYVRDYVSRIKATENEDAIRALGPPLSFHEMASPVGSTDEQREELFWAQNTNDELDAWVAIAHQLDAFAGRKSQGLPFFRIKPKYKADPKHINRIKKFIRPGMRDIPEKIPVEIEVEWQVDIQIVDGDIRIIEKADALIKINAIKLKEDNKFFEKEMVKKVTRKGFPLELGFKQSLGDLDKRVLQVKVDVFAFEQDTLGKTKMSLQYAPGFWVDSEFSTRSGEFGLGGTLKFKEIADKLKKISKETGLPAGKLQKWADKLEGLEISVLVGFVGTREETILATVSGAPGFFERRAHKELFHPDTQWNDLNLDEQVSLASLGWDQETWNTKYMEEFADDLPESIHKIAADLTSAEKVAIVHLGFFTYEDYRKAFKKAFEAHKDYVF